MSPGGVNRILTPEVADKDWRWRAKIRSNPASQLIYRILVAIVGLVIVLLGLIMVPLPGQGWLVVLLGLAVLASEFAWAKRLLRFVRRALQVWTRWLLCQPLWIKASVIALTVAALVAAFWLVLLISGVPNYFPGLWQQWLRRVPGLG
jgi:uncharacterized protein (TIGR02611 family)